MPTPKRSPGQLEQTIKNANRPNWDGNGGLEDMMLNLLDLIRYRLLITVDDLTALAAISGADGQNVLVRGVGIFKFNPNNSGTHPDSSIQGLNGIWDLFGAIPAGPMRQLVGDGGSLTFAVPHNLNAAFPSVQVFAYSAPGVSTFPYTVATDYTVTVTSANSITITQTGNTPWAGNSHLVVVKPS